MSKNKSNIENKWIFIIKTALVLVAFSAVIMAIFAAIMYFFELDKNYSPLIATISVAIGCLVASYFASGKIGSKGYITGTIIGFATFVIVTIISLIIDQSSITSNTLFHFIIFILSSLIGGVSGVNKKPKKYI